jgi:predicted permease
MLSRIRSVGRRITSLFGRDGLDERLRAEMELHALLLTERHERNGMAPDDARRQARLALGSVARAREEYRDRIGFRLIEDFASDLRLAGRQLRRSPGFAVLATATLALGIGANTAMFSVVNGVLLKPLPFDDPDRLVSVRSAAPGVGSDRMALAPAQYFTYRDAQRAFEDVAVWTLRRAALTGPGDPEQVPTLWVTDGFLSLLRVRPALGRGFDRADDQPGSPPRAVISYGCWLRRFGGDTRVLGQRVTIDGEPYEIIGVLPRSFTFLEPSPEVMVTLQFDRAATRIQDFSYRGLARLKPGVTLDQARLDVARMIALVPQRFAMADGSSPSWFRDAKMGPDVRPLAEDASGGVGNVLWVLMGAIGLVLLVACANVANLFLVRAEGRRQELAVRAALGAGSFRLARALLSESVMLALGGGLAGVALAATAIPVLRAMAPGALPRVTEIALAPSVLFFAALISVLAGLLFGLVPVLRLATFRPGWLQDGGRTSSDGRDRHRTRSALVVAEIALALVLLISSALMIRTFQSLRRVDPGFMRGHEVLTVALRIPPSLAASGEQVLQKHREFIGAVSRVPGVQSVGLGSWIPFDGGAGSNSMLVEDRPPAPGQVVPSRRTKWISPGYFETVGGRLVAGRQITWDDVLGYAPVALVNERLAREVWRTPAAALGKRVRESVKSPWREIVGVLGDERPDSLAEAAPAIVYYPLLTARLAGGGLQAQRRMVYVIRSARAGSPGFANEIRQALWSVDRATPLLNMRTLEEATARSMARTSFALVMLGVAAGVSLLLGVIGIYGVVAYITAQRTREVGIRVALGAQTRDVARLFVGHGLALTGLGIGLGLGAAAALARLMTSMLFGVSATDPLTYVATSIGLAGVAILASYLPARRAARVDPLAALRSE